jgi:hypothetical protein
MKLLLALITLTSMNLAQAGWKSQTKATLREYANECRTTEVVVDEIIKNDVIRGHIQGMSPASYNKFKVVFYVKTDKWYVHPFTFTPRQEEGYSYSNLDANGNFKIRTVLREVASQKMAVVLVPKSYNIKSSRWRLNPLFGIFGGVLKNSCNHTIVPGNGDFFMESL